MQIYYYAPVFILIYEIKTLKLFQKCTLIDHCEDIN